MTVHCAQCTCPLWQACTDPDSCSWQGNGRGNPRDYYITTKDVFNIKTHIEQLEWRHDADQATSLRTFTQLNPDNILFYQEVEPLPGECMLLQRCL